MAEDGKTAEAGSGAEYKCQAGAWRSEKEDRLPPAPVGRSTGGTRVIYRGGLLPR